MSAYIKNKMKFKLENINRVQVYMERGRGSQGVSWMGVGDEGRQ